MKRNMVIVGVVAALTIAIMVVLMVGVSSTVSELAVEINKNQVDAVLASANVEDDTLISVPVNYYTQTDDECFDLYSSDLGALKTRQFEWSKCGYYHKALEKEMTEPELNSDFVPVARGGVMLPNRGVTKENFARWFSAVEGKSKLVPANFDFYYNAETVSFSYENNNFKPVGRSLFTMSLGLPVEVTGNGKENFSITADDDTWVFLNNKIVLDMGGIHAGIDGKFEIRENGEVYAAVGDEGLAYSGVKLEVGKPAVIRIFHANRDSDDSVFDLKLENMLLNVRDSVLAKTESNEDGMMVAYNPDEPGYIAPLGESVTIAPDKSRMILSSIVAQAAMMVALAASVMVAFSVLLRQARKK